MSHNINALVLLSLQDTVKCMREYPQEVSNTKHTRHQIQLQNTTVWLCRTSPMLGAQVSAPRDRLGQTNKKANEWSDSLEINHLVFGESWVHKATTFICCEKRILGSIGISIASVSLRRAGVRDSPYTRCPSRSSWEFSVLGSLGARAGPDLHYPKHCPQY